MNENTNTEIKCIICGEWLQSPISFGDLQSFETATIYGNTVLCPNGHTTSCDKENMRFRYTDSDGKEYFIEE
jgi:hypothetical protein